MGLKLTQKQLLDLAGVALAQDVEIVEEDKADKDFTVETGLQAIDSSRLSILKPKWETEAAKTIETQEKGRAAGSLRTALARAAGIEPSRFTADMSYGDMIKMGIEAIQANHATDAGDVQKKIDELTNTLNKEWQEKLTPLEKERDEWKGKYTKRDLIEAVQKELKGAPLPEKLDRSIAASDFMNYLESLYEVRSNNGVIELYDKTTPTMHALNGSQKIKVLDEAKNFFEPRNNWQTDTRNTSAAAATNAQANNVNNTAPAEKVTGADYRSALKAATDQLVPQ